MAVGVTKTDAGSFGTFEGSKFRILELGYLKSATILNPDVDGQCIPKMTNSTPNSFFDHLETEGFNLCRWLVIYTWNFTMERILRR